MNTNGMHKYIFAFILRRCYQFCCLCIDTNMYIVIYAFRKTPNVQIYSIETMLAGVCLLGMRLPEYLN